jgi:hypothetical protein
LGLGHYLAADFSARFQIHETSIRTKGVTDKIDIETVLSKEIFVSDLAK